LKSHLESPAQRTACTFSTHAPGDARWALVFAAWLVATTATLAALFLSQVMDVAPCALCWYQRVFMFPLVLVLGSGLLADDRNVLRYAGPMAIAGWSVALFHWLLVNGIVPATMTPCTQGIPCSRIDVEWFGFVTIPLLSLLSFSAIGLALGAASTKARP